MRLWSDARNGNRSGPLFVNGGDVADAESTRGRGRGSNDAAAPSVPAAEMTASTRAGIGRAATLGAMILAGLALLLLAVVPSLAGQEVVLRLKDGDFEIGGELRSFDGRRYVVSTSGFGDLSLDASRYACVSGACRSESAEAPRPGAPRATLEFVGRNDDKPAANIVVDAAPALGPDLLPSLIRGYARHLGATARQHVGVDAATSRFQIADARGTELAALTLNRRGSDAVLAALKTGSATLGATTRAVTPAELAAMPGPGARVALLANEHVLGLDGLAVIVPPGSRATRLATAQVARILAGEVRDWSEVGLPAGPIQVYAGDEQVPDSLATVLGRPRGLTLAPTTNRIADEAQLSDAVARDPSAIGIASLTQLRNARSLDLTLACGLTVRASEFAIKTEEYPLSRRLYLYSNGQPKEPMAQELVRFATSQVGQQAIREGGLLDQSIVYAPEAEDRSRIAEARASPRSNEDTRALTARLATDVDKARRLSTTFRFAIGSSGLDAKARGDIGRLAELMRSPALKGRTLMLVGFTDASGPAHINAALSVKRANEVRDALLKSIPGSLEGLPTVVAAGYGPAAPVACNGGDAGQYRNRRVEVWVRDGAMSPPAVAATPRPADAKAGKAAGVKGRGRRAEVGQKQVR